VLVCDLGARRLRGAPRYFEMMGQMAGQSNTIVFGGDGPGDMRRMAAELATVSAGKAHIMLLSCKLQLCRCLSELSGNRRFPHCVQVFKALPLMPSSVESK
jgi:hypothetical protein